MAEDIANKISAIAEQLLPEQPTYQDMEDVAGTLLSLPQFKGMQKAEIIDIISADRKIYQLPSTIMQDEEEGADWLTEFRAKSGCSFRFWNDYKKSLTLPAPAILEIDRTTDLMLNYEIDYIAKHPTVAKPSEFEISDADYDLFKQAVIKSGFTYDQVSEKYLKDLESLARFEGYYDDAKAEFEALKKKLKHNIAKDLDYPYNKQKIKEMLAADIMPAYYFESGAIENSLRTDKQMEAAVKLLNDAAEYKRLLAPQPKTKADSKQEQKKDKEKKK